MICQRCGRMMRLNQGGYHCLCLSEGIVTSGDAPVAGDPPGRPFRQLQERVAKLESIVADLKRAVRLPSKGPPRFLGETAEEPTPEEPGETR